jgi:digeranylgeranylglycerophospholipid reductase
MTKYYDVIIIGAGVAGIMTAKELSNLKKKVLLIDANEDILHIPFHTLGSFINIKEFGFTEKVIASEIDGMTIHSKKFSHKSSGKAYIIDKERLHKEIIENFNSENLDIKTETVIEDYILNSDNSIKEVLDSKGNRYSAKIFVDTTGIQGILSRKLGLQDKDLKLAKGIEYNVKYKGDPNKVIFIIGKYVDGGYVWLFPLKNRRAILGFCSLKPEIIDVIPQRIHKLFIHPVLKDLIEKDNDKIEAGSIPITNVKTKFVNKNLVCIGDSVSQVNPLAGEGYHFILSSAVMASKAINSALDQNNLSLLQQYERDWYNKFYKSYNISHFLRNGLSRFSNRDLLIDLGVLFLKTKRDKTIEKIMTGDFSYRELFLP